MSVRENCCPTRHDGRHSRRVNCVACSLQIPGRTLVYQLEGKGPADSHLRHGTALRGVEGVRGMVRPVVSICTGRFNTKSCSFFPHSVLMYSVPFEHLCIHFSHTVSWCIRYHLNSRHPFFPHSVLMYSVSFEQQASIICPHSLDYLVLLMQQNCVLCKLQTQSSCNSRGKSSEGAVW